MLILKILITLLIIVYDIMFITSTNNPTIYERFNVIFNNLIYYMLILK